MIYLFAGWNISRFILKQQPVEFPATTMLGALCYYITHASPKDFQPMKANFGILPPLNDGQRRNKRERAKAHASRSKAELGEFLKREAFQ